MFGVRRLVYAALAVATVGVGLYCRWPGAGLPPHVAKYAGSVLWGMLVYWCVAVLLPRVRTRIVLLASACIAVAVETSQLVHVDWLDRIRRGTIGALLLGRVFAWSDIAAYLIGIVVAGAADHAILRRRRR